MKLKTLVIAIGITSTLFFSPVTMASFPVVLPSPLFQDYSWNGVFRFLDSNGAALSNTSLSYKASNSFDTPISGTMTFDPNSGSGSATVSAFHWGSQQPELPFDVTSFDLQSIGDGMGGAGTLILGNLLFNWNGNTGSPISIILDAKGFYAGDLDGRLALGATPASDGTYVGAYVPDTVNGPEGYPGYLGLGPIPIATTAWNTTANCTTNIDCIGNEVSGILPLVYDNAINDNDYTANDGGGIGGSPLLDGPFQGLSFTLEMTDMTFVPEVPVPAALWLFGSGLLGLIGVTRRRKS